MHINQWLSSIYEKEMEKSSAAELERLFDRMPLEEVLKIAQSGDLSQSERNELPAKAFAIPESKAEKIGVEGEIQGEAAGKYPIPDLAHAKNALARVSQHGTPDEKEAVRSKVYAKYPQLKEGFEESHGGESPTSKENIKKPEQGEIGKEAMAKLAFVDSVARQIARAHMEKTAYEEKGSYPTYVRMRQRMSESSPLNAALGLASGASAGQYIGGNKGALLGSVLGTGAGALKAHLSKRKRDILSDMGPAHVKKANLEMEKQDEFTSPKAQAKAQVMSRALKSTKGAPSNVRKAAVKVTAKQINAVKG